jgi:ribonuclease P protein component
MLRARGDFATLQETGRSRSHPLLAVRVRRNGLEHNRYGIATGRRLGTAVTRNRVRRRLREVLRMLHPRLDPGSDILVVARAGSVSASANDLLTALERMLLVAETEEGTTTK